MEVTVLSILEDKFEDSPTTPLSLTSFLSYAELLRSGKRAAELPRLVTSFIVLVAMLVTCTKQSDMESPGRCKGEAIYCKSQAFQNSYWLSAP